MHSHHPVIPYVSLCSGYEGIGLGLHRCIPNLRAVAYCEREAFAIANLVAKMENGFLDSAPVFTDVATFPWAELTEVMAGGVLSFGWPCQPVSTAGKRKATEDERWLFDIIADGIAIMRPGILFAENVEGLLSAKMPDGSSVFGHCIQRLESLHYRVAAGIFSASEVGAPHQRKRVFILAVSSSFRGASGLSGSFTRYERQSGESDDGGGQGMADTECGGLIAGRNDAGQSQGSQSEHCSAWPSRPGEQQYGWEPPRVISGLENTTGQRSRCESGDALHQGWTASEAGTESVPQDTGWSDGAAIADDQPTGGDGEELGDTGCERQEERQVEAGGSEQSDEVRDVADSSFIGSDRRPDRSCRWSGESGEAGVNATGSGSQGDGMRQAQPPLGGNTDGTSSGLDYAELCVSCDNRTDELRLLGNGVVPATAHRAFCTLIRELDDEEAGR